jgi:hypothetical protein
MLLMVVAPDKLDEVESSHAPRAEQKAMESSHVSSMHIAAMQRVSPWHSSNGSAYELA